MKAVVYTRFSSDKQKKGYSLEEQKKACFEKALKDGCEIDRIFEEPAESAQTLDRPQLISLLNYLKKNKVDYLYVYDISRLSRNSIDFLVIKKELSKRGVIVSSVNGLPNDSLEGDLVQDLLARVSQYQNELSAQKVKGGMKNRVLQGYALRGAPGYIMIRNEEGKARLIEDKETFEVYKNMWLKILHESLSVKQALKFVNLSLPQNKKATKSSLARMLSNKLYCGILSYPAYGNVEIRGKHPAMITEATFNQVRYILTGRSHQNTKLRTKVNPRYPLTKILLCPNCNGTISAGLSN